MNKITLIETPVFKDGRYVARDDAGRWMLHEENGFVVSPLPQADARLLDSAMTACDGFLQYSRMTERHQSEIIDQQTRELAAVRHSLVLAVHGRRDTWLLVFFLGVLTGFLAGVFR